MISLSLFRNENAQELTPGQVLFQEGDEGSNMYVVTEGEVEIRIGKAVAEVVTPGGIFGEMALIDHTTRSASAVAKTAAKVVVINKRRFEFLVTQTPYFSLQVMSIMAERLRRANDRFKDVV